MHGELRKFVAPEFIYGADASGLTGRHAANLGVRKVLLVTDPAVAEQGISARVEQSLLDAGISVAVFGDVSANPRDTEIMAGAEAYRREQCDGLVAVGGGSPMDCAKGIGIVSGNGRHILEFEGVDQVARPGPPLICIPTTAGSSADVSQFAIVNDTTRRVKIAIVSKMIIPDSALIDPLLTMSMGRDLTAHTGLDALTHAVEAYVSNAHSAISDLLALEAIRLIRGNLGLAMDEPKSLDARGNVCLGSLYAGLAFSNAILGAVHAMAHSLGGRLDLPHDLCNAILLDTVIAFNYEAAPERHAEIGRILGADVPAEATLEEGREAVVEAVRRFKAELGVTADLSSLGVRPEDIAELAALAVLDPCMITNPRAASVEDLKTLYAQAL